MKAVIDLTSVCGPSEAIVAREIEGEIIIVPLVAGIGDADDELFTLNETGRAIWQRLDGRRSVGDVVSALVAEYDADAVTVEADVLGFVAEMTDRGILSVVE